MSFFSRLLGPRAVPSSVPAPDRDRARVLYKFDACPYCVRVMVKAKELGLELDMRDTRRDRAHHEEMVKRTGRTQVPLLFVDDQPLWESADINAWLTAYASRSPA
ncbi:MAG: NrdH-redoxin [Proteobacteria bacterium]|nr:NrdH-redoxin [Pseudomonadota bacterium]